jgi:hypothetical protein
MVIIIIVVIIFTLPAQAGQWDAREGFSSSTQATITRGKHAAGHQTWSQQP